MLSDQHKRNEVLNPEHSYIVSAPAGSGKTELLIQRFLKVLALSEKPEQVLMITFTRKAVAEVRKRIYKALHDAVENKPITETHQQQTRNLALAVLQQDTKYQWQLLFNPTRLQIKTIDGLCFYLAQQTSLAQGQGVFNSVVDNANELYEEAVVSLIESLASPSAAQTNATGYQQLRQLLQVYDNNLQLIVDMFCNMLSNRSSWLEFLFDDGLTIEAIQYNFSNYAQQLLDVWKQAMGAKLYELLSLSGFAQHQLLTMELEGKRLEEAQLLPDNQSFDTISVASWKALIKTLLLTKEGEWRKSLNKNQGFIPKTEQKEAMLSLLEEFNVQPDLLDLTSQLLTLPSFSSSNKADEDTVDWPHLSTLMQLLPTLVAHLSFVFQQRNQCDHNAVAQAAIDALEHWDEPTELALRLDYQIRHILVDEFQDTSSQQEKLLQLITAGWQPNDGRSLFIVGDAMQSIYSFRQAEVGLFIQARKNGIGELPLIPKDIDSNFRSQANIVHWVNDTFKNIFPKQDNCSQNQTAYHDSQPIKASDTLVDAVKYSLFHHMDDEAQWLVESIKEIQQHQPDASIAILVRQRNDLKAILPVLNQQSINWNGNDLLAINQQMAVVDIISLTKALVSWSDKLAWLALLRSPLIGLTASDLYYCCQTNFSDEFNTEANRQSDVILWQQINDVNIQNKLSKEAKQILQRVIPILQNSINHKGLVPLRERIEDCWRALGAEHIISSITEWNDCMTFFDSLEQQGNGQSIDWQEFEEQLAKTYSQPNNKGGDNKTLTSIEIMTIHKAKGLEFDYVFIPSMQRIGGNDSSPLIRWRKQLLDNGENQLLLAPKPATTDTDEFYDCLKADATQQGLQETQRLLYVACTRASKQLILSATLKPTDKEEYNVAKKSLLAIIWDQYCDDFISHLHESDVNHLSEQALSEPIIVEQGIWRQEETTLQYCQQWTDVDQSRQQLATTILPLNYTIDIEAGNLIHRTLKQIVLDGIEKWDSERLHRQLMLWQNHLQQQGFEAAMIETALTTIAQAVDTSLNDVTGRWILNNQHQYNHVEYSLDTLTDQATVKTKIIDRFFVEDDCCWIIDYKSSQPKNNQTLEQFKAEQTRLYSKQLNEYQYLLQSIVDAQQFKKMLYFPIIGKSAIIP